MPHDDVTVTATFKANPSAWDIIWSNIKPAGAPLLKVLKSLLPLLKAFFGNVVSIVKGIVGELDIDLPF